MQFRANDRDRRKVKATVDLTPLIDVVFLLIIFFMLSATFVVQSSIPVEIPEADGSSKWEEKDLTITLMQGKDGPGGGGKIFVGNDEMTSMAQLSERLADELAAHPKLMVLIRPDARIEAGRLVRVMGIASSVGIENYGLAARPPDEES
jgi:biopolymer transport protein ExbD